MKPTKITKSARGQACQVRIPDVCNGNSETVVLAHLNGGGMGMKNPDYQGAYVCSSCHDEIDGRTFSGVYSKTEIALSHLEGVIRTQELLREQGLLIAK